MSIFPTPPFVHEPYRWTGKRIGLLGGSFDPAHNGHLHISLAALRTLKLDYVWWLVSPQNPLKAHAPSSIDERIVAAHAVASHPRVIISDLECQMRTQLSYNTMKSLSLFFPNTKFVWITGMDNAHTLHKWHYWQALLSEVSMLHIARPPARNLVRSSPNSINRRQSHVFVQNPGFYDLSPGRSYWLMHAKMVDISSTALRKN